MAGRKSNGAGDQGQLYGRNEENPGGQGTSAVGGGGWGGEGIKVRVAAKFVKSPPRLLRHIFLDSNFRLVS